MNETYDAVVVGAGHAGCEAALALARMGHRTLLLTLNIDGVALMACNPAIGGTAKGHLVRELDALGGEMGLAIDDTFLQSRMLNTGKGPAVHSLRAQADKKMYQFRMLRALQRQEGLTLTQGQVERIELENGRVCAVHTALGQRIGCRVCVLCTGVYLKSRIIIGEYTSPEGPSGLQSAGGGLSESLREMGFSLRRFKTGTPARVDIRTVDLSKLEPQYGDARITPFSFLNDDLQKDQACCYLGYTNARTHEIIRANLHRAPMFTGIIEGVGPRYCPSIEDKVVRFADKDRHPFFLEPESVFTTEWYVQGMSSSLPQDVQTAFYRSMEGLENVRITRYAYAIEYDCIDPTALKTTLESKDIPGLFFAGQINGSSGYEEAAAQGIVAGINAALFLQDRPPLVLGRADAYIGVLIDDLTTKGTNEPYRMMTSRAEYRLHLRQDNADLRLTEKGLEVGLATRRRAEKLEEKRRDIRRGLDALKAARFSPQALSDAVGGSFSQPLSGTEALRHDGVTYANLQALDGTLPQICSGAREQIEILMRYEGYLKRQESQMAAFRRMESMQLPKNVDYESIGSLRLEARQKLSRIRPETLGQAARISGVSPGDISVLMVWMEKKRRENTQ